MALLIFFVATGAAIAAVVAYVVWRDRRHRTSFVDPSVSRDALVEADRQGVQGRLAGEDLVITDFLRPRRPNRSDPP